MAEMFKVADHLPAIVWRKQLQLGYRCGNHPSLPRDTELFLEAGVDYPDLPDRICSTNSLC
jgi:hypothetical protein